MGKNIVTRIDPSDKPALKRFISLERKLMKDYSNYISEIDGDVSKTLTRKTQMAKKWNSVCLLHQNREMI